MQKSKLDKFISKYNLGGNVNSVKWKSSGDSIGEGAEVGGTALVEIQKITAEMEAKKKAELVNLCKEKGLPTTGTKAELVARLAEAESVSTVEDDTDATTI